MSDTNGPSAGLRETKRDTNTRGNAGDLPVAEVRGTESISEHISDRESFQHIPNQPGWRERKIGKFQPASSHKFFAGTTTYYFTNFPDSYGVEDMRQGFLKWGRVSDVFIPLKKDKYGKRFHFVSFQDVMARLWGGYHILEKGRRYRRIITEWRKGLLLDEHRCWLDRRNTWRNVSSRPATHGHHSIRSQCSP